MTGWHFKDVFETRKEGKFIAGEVSWAKAKLIGDVCGIDFQIFLSEI